MSEGVEKVDMDKKQPGRQSSVPPKGNSADSKKDNGNNNNQKLPRQSRRKHHGNHSHDQQPSNRRPPSQKSSRWMDKRPRPRGVHNGGHPDEMTSVERTEPEYGSVQAWGSKKNNMSHLLNFHFEPRETYGSGHRGWGGRPWKGRGSRSTWRGPRYNKEQFLQANFQFIVQDSGDYRVHTVDPDVLVDWDLIEQVRIYGHENASCPICLYPPTVAKITRCGHIYCWSCILHYLSLGDKNWRRCPICYDAILQKDLKSVKIVETSSYHVGEEITLKLMKRMKGSTQAMPMGQWKDREGQLYNIDDPVDIRYAKLLVMTKEQVQEMVSGEKQLLEVQLAEEGSNTLEGSFVKAAIELVKERLAILTDTAVVTEPPDEKLGQDGLEDKKITEATKALEMQARKTVVYNSAFSDDEEETNAAEHPENPNESVAEDEVESHTGDVVADSGRSCSESSGETDQSTEVASGEDNDTRVEKAGTVAVCTEEGAVQEVSVTAAAEELSMPQETHVDGTCPKRNLNYFYFFQAMDGQHIYIHSINAQCLVREYGSLENCPDTITAKIVELNGITMNEDLRHRLRYLGHLPVTCEFQVAELALKPPIVSADTLRAFSDKIEKKKRQRQKKSREEKRFSKRIEAEENKRMGIDRKSVIVRSEAANIQREVLTAEHDSFQSTPVGSPAVAGESSEVLATSPKSPVGSDDGGQCSMSFAQMLKAGKAKPQENVPRAAGISPGQDRPRVKGSDSEDSENEDRVPVPVYQASFGDAIQRALDKYKGPEEPAEQPSVPSVTPSKKKKKLKTLLFTTSVNRAK